MDITFYPAKTFRHTTNKFLDMETNLLFTNGHPNNCLSYAWQYILSGETEFADRAERVVKPFLRSIKKTAQFQRLLLEPSSVSTDLYRYRLPSLETDFFYALSTLRHPFTDKALHNELPNVYLDNPQETRSFLKTVSAEYGRDQLLLWLEKLGASVVNLCPENVIVILRYEPESVLRHISFPYPTRLGIDLPEGLEGRSHKVKIGTPRPQDVVNQTVEYLREINRVNPETAVPLGSRTQVRVDNVRLVAVNIDGARRLEENEI